MTNKRTHNQQGLTFDQWYSKADRYCENISNLSLSDLGYYNYRDSWWDGDPPALIVRQILRKEGFPLV